MHKNLYTWGVVALATTAAVLTACHNEEVAVDLTKPIRLEVGLVQQTAETRVSIEDNATFEANNAIGIYMGEPQSTKQDGGLGSFDKYSNVQYTTPDGTAWSGDAIYWQSTTKYHTLYAYSPYNSDMSATTTTAAFTLAQDQHANSGANYKAVDFLWGKTAAVQPHSSALPIQLKHCMSLIKVTITPGDDMTTDELAMLALCLKGSIKADGAFDLKTGACTARGTQTASALTAITPYRSSGNVFYAIVMPGTEFTHQSDFVKLTAPDGTSYLYKLDIASGTGFTAAGGSKYEFALKASKKGIELTQFEIAAWNPGTGDTNGEANMVI